MGVINKILKINVISLIFFILIQIFFVFLIEYKINFIDIPSIVYLEQKSLFPINTYNSLSFSVFMGLILLVPNNLLAFYLANNALKASNRQETYPSLINFRSQYRIIYFLGYGILDASRTLDILKKSSKKIKIEAIIFCCFLIFIVIYWIFDLSFLGFSKNLVSFNFLIYFVSSFKYCLYFLNVVIFLMLAFFVNTCLASIYLIFHSFFKS